MTKATLFAGAGFSRAVSEKVKYCGNENINMPLANEMFNNKSSEDYLGGIKFPDHKYSRLGSYLLVNYGSRNPGKNYEEIYGELKNDLAEVLEEMVFEHLGVNFPPHRIKCEAEQTIKIIREFIANENITKIITTNPDILLDTAIMGATEFDDKFLKLFGDYYYKLNLIEEECKNWQPVLRKNESFERLKSISSFVKIHGSITMASKDEKYFWQSKYKWYKGISSAMYKHNGAYKRCVIPPNPGKRYKKSPWKELIREAKNILKDTDKLIFYGFGFGRTDKHLKEELEDSLKNINDIKVIDKNSDSVDFTKRVNNWFPYKESNINFVQTDGI